MLGELMGFKSKRKMCVDLHARERYRSLLVPKGILTVVDSRKSVSMAVSEVIALGGLSPYGQHRSVPEKMLYCTDYERTVADALNLSCAGFGLEDQADRLPQFLTAREPVCERAELQPRLLRIAEMLAEMRTPCKALATTNATLMPCNNGVLEVGEAPARRGRNDATSMPDEHHENGVDISRRSCQHRLMRLGSENG
jgi:hypothetical protein